MFNLLIKYFIIHPFLPSPFDKLDMVQNVNLRIQKLNYVKFNIIQNTRPKFAKLFGKMELAHTVKDVVSSITIKNDSSFAREEIVLIM